MIFNTGKSPRRIAWFFVLPFILTNALYLPKMFFAPSEYKAWWGFFVALPSIVSTIISFILVIIILIWKKVNGTLSSEAQHSQSR